MTITAKRYREIYDEADNNSFKLLSLLCAELTVSKGIGNNSIADYLEGNEDILRELINNIERKEVEFYDNAKRLCAEDVERVKNYVRLHRKDCRFYDLDIDGPDPEEMTTACGDEFGFYIDSGFYHIHFEVFEIVKKVLSTK